MKTTKISKYDAENPLMWRAKMLAETYGQEDVRDKGRAKAIMSGIDELPDTDEIYHATKDLMAQIVKDHGTPEAFKANRDPHFAYLIGAMMHRSVMDPSSIPWLEQAINLLDNLDSADIGLQLKVLHTLANQY